LTDGYFGLVDTNWLMFRIPDLGPYLAIRPN
jgi:hypothetical protein